MSEEKIIQRSAGKRPDRDSVKLREFPILQDGVAVGAWKDVE
jgi:hypothetical protein